MATAQVSPLLLPSPNKPAPSGEIVTYWMLDIHKFTYPVNL